MIIYVFTKDIQKNYRITENLHKTHEKVDASLIIIGDNDIR